MIVSNWQPFIAFTCVCEGNIGFISCLWSSGVAPLCCLCCVAQMIYVLVEDTTWPSFISCVTMITLEVVEELPPTVALWRGRITAHALNISINSSI